MTDVLDLSSLRDALHALEQSLQVVGQTAWFSQQTPAVQNTLIAGVIQDFEFVYEQSIKMLRRELEKSAASPEEVDFSNYRDQLRAAAEKGLLTAPETWFKYRAMRNITAHTYDHGKAQQIYQEIPAFMADAHSLLGQLEIRNAQAT